MSKVIVLDGDNLQFDPQFGNRLVTPLGPATIRGSGHATVQNRKVCVAGDEGKVQVQASYTTMAGHVTPGQGLITIAALAANQKTPRCSSRAAIVIKGQKFTARFTPTQPAQKPGATPEPDAPAPSMGQGQFITRQTFAMAKG